MPNICKEQSCGEKLSRKGHYLCPTHWEMAETGDIDECPSCGVYKDSKYNLCIKCNKKKRIGNTQRIKTAPTEKPAKPRKYDFVKADTFQERSALLEEDQKAQDKRQLFDDQDHRCVYCGNKYGYDELQIEHMIPKVLGGPDHIRNCQLACRSCNKAKGTMTDIKFRKNMPNIYLRKNDNLQIPPSIRRC